MRNITLMAILVTAVIISGIYISGCGKKPQPETKAEPAEKSIILEGKKIFYIDSYHESYEPGMAQRAAFSRGLNGKGAETKYFFMDTKNHPASAEMAEAGKKCMKEIKQYAPHLIIAADDPACKEVIAPYFAGGKIPVIFIGVNWSAKACSYPAPNVTGQIEVEFVSEMLAEIKKYAKGGRISLITADTLTDRKSVDHYIKVMGMKFTETVFVKDFQAWIKAYKKSQKTSDALFFRNSTGIEGWEDSRAIELIIKETKVPSGTVSAHMPRFVLIGMTKDNSEFGEYAAETALKILNDNISPDSLPVTANARVGMKLNMNLAKKLGIVFKDELIEKASFVEEDIK